MKKNSTAEKNLGKNFFSTKRNSLLLKTLILLLLPFVLYISGVDFSYILDDKIVYSENDFVTQGVDGLDDILMTESFTGYFGEQKNLVEGGRYRPLSLLTFALEYEFFKLNPRVAHLGNIILYALCGILLFLFARRIEKNLLPESLRYFLSFSFVLGSLFLIHPIHTEVVANIKGRDEILSLFFNLLALMSVVSSLDKFKYYKLFLTFLFLFLACMSKENAITMLGIVPLSIWAIDKSAKKSLLWHSLAALFAVGLYLIIRHNVLGFTFSDQEITSPMNNSFYGMNASQRSATIFYTLSRYLEILFFPHPLSHDYYPYAIPVANWGMLRPWIGIISHLLLAGYALYKFIWQKPNLPAYGILFYLITLSIVSNVFFNIGTTMNERFVFTPSVGFLIAAISLFYIPAIRIPRFLKITFLGIALSFFAYKTISRVPDWRNNLTLNRSAVQSNPRSARANLFMGTALFKESETSSDRNKRIALLKEADPYLTNAITIWQKYGNSTTRYFNYPDAYNMKAGVTGKLHNFGEISDEDLFKRYEYLLSRNPATSYIPEYMEYLHNRTSREKLLDFYYKVARETIPNLAAQVNPGYYNNALQYIDLALKLDSQNAVLYSIMADIYELKGDAGKAQTLRDKALRIDSNNE